MDGDRGHRLTQGDFEHLLGFHVSLRGFERWRESQAQAELHKHAAALDELVAGVRAGMQPGTASPFS